MKTYIDNKKIENEGLIIGEEIVGNLAEQCKQDFPLLQQMIDGRPITYLDSAATSLKPRQVTDEIVRYYHEVGANIHRGKHFLSDQASTDFEAVRAKVAQFTGFLSNEVVFTSNTTASINIVASGLQMKQSDIVLIPFDAHHSAMLPWRKVADVHYIPIDNTGVIDLNKYRELLHLKPTLVVINSCSNVTGCYSPVEEMAAMAKEVGALTLVDAAQAVGHRSILCKNIDFLVFSAHKMLGPTGLGVLCGRQEHLMRLVPSSLGGGMVDWVDINHFEFRKIPHSLEAGTPNIAAVYGLGAAIDYLMNIGYNELINHDRNLGRVLVHNALKRPYMNIIGSVDNVDRGGILSFSIKGVHNLKEIAKILSDSYGIFCRTGHMCAQPFIDSITDDEILRVSGYIYNDNSDIDFLFSALDDVIQYVSRKK